MNESGLAKWIVFRPPENSEEKDPQRCGSNKAAGELHRHHEQVKPSAWPNAARPLKHPALAVFAAHQFVRFRQVDDTHLFGVPLDLLAGAQRHQT